MTQHDNILFVPVPEDAFDCEIGTRNRIGWWENHLFGSYWEQHDLPPGDWRIIGTTDTMVEEEWGQVVDHLTDYEMMRSGYKNYKKWAHEYDLFDNATTSGQTLLQSLGITQRCAVLIKTDI